MPWLLRMLFILTSVVLLLYGYAGSRLYQALGQLTSWSEPRRLGAIILVTGLINVYPLAILMTYLWGSEWWLVALRGGNKLVDMTLTYPFWIGLIIVAQLFPFFLAIDLGWFVLSLFAKNSPTWMVWQARLVVLITGLVTVYAVARISHDTWHIRVRERIIASNKFSPGTPELRLVHITDVQMDPRTSPEMVSAFVEKVNQLNPDLVIFTGDLITSGTAHIDRAATLLGRIQARYGIFACLGDHDVWADPEWITRSLEANGIQVLEDEHRWVETEHGRIELTGITNVYRRRPQGNRLRQLIHGDRERSFAIFIAHQPSDSLVKFVAERGYDLFLAGHMHGGQVVLNYFGFQISPALRDSSYLSGFYRIDGMVLSVSNGLGLTFAPVRFRAPAEITLLRIVASPSGVDR